MARTNVVLCNAFAKVQRNPHLVVWTALVVALCLAALILPNITPYSPIQANLQDVNHAPSAAYLLGTDSVGRDILSRTMAALPTSLFAAFGIALASFAIGVVVGALSGYIGGWLDTVIMRIVDAFMAFPQLVLAIAVAGLLGGGLTNAMIALVAVAWTRYARLARAQVLSVKTRTYITAARISGASGLSIAFKHVVPNILQPLIIMVCLDAGNMVLNLAGLSFLGLGAAPPTPELGSMINQAAATFQTAPWAVFAPGAVLFIIVVVLNMFGDAVNDALNSHTSQIPVKRRSCISATVDEKGL